MPLSGNLRCLESCLLTMHVCCDMVGSDVDGARAVTLISVEHKHFFYHVGKFSNDFC